MKLIHQLMGCPWCLPGTSSEIFPADEAHWPCENRTEEGAGDGRWWRTPDPTRSECFCGGDCFALRVEHG